MKLIAILALIISGCASAPQQQAQSQGETQPKPLVSKWSVASKMEEPESAYYDQGTQTVFVSNVAGEPDGKDKKGWISQLATDGAIINSEFATGLNAPKGLRSSKGTLWVTDIDEVVAISIATRKVTNRFKITGAKFLNDIGIADDGTVYVSDMVTNRIHMIKDGKVSVFIEGKNLESPNGLCVNGGRLVVASWGSEMQPDFSTKTLGHLYAIDLKTKEITNITKTPLGHLDGLELVGAKVFLVSDWMAGKVFVVTFEGEVKEILSGFKGAADIGWIGKETTLLVPRMGENQVTAYLLKK